MDLRWFEWISWKVCNGMEGLERYGWIWGVCVNFLGEEGVGGVGTVWMDPGGVDL